MALDVDIVLCYFLWSPVYASKQVGPPGLNFLAGQTGAHLPDQLQLHEEGLVIGERALLQQFLSDLVRLHQKSLHEEERVLFVVAS